MAMALITLAVSPYTVVQILPGVQMVALFEFNVLMLLSFGLVNTSTLTREGQVYDIQYSKLHLQ